MGEGERRGQATAGALRRCGMGVLRSQCQHICCSDSVLQAIQRGRIARAENKEMHAAALMVQKHWRQYDTPSPLCSTTYPALLPLPRRRWRQALSTNTVAITNHSCACLAYHAVHIGGPLSLWRPCAAGNLAVCTTSRSYSTESAERASICWPGRASTRSESRQHNSTHSYRRALHFRRARRSSASHTHGHLQHPYGRSRTLP